MKDNHATVFAPSNEAEHTTYPARIGLAPAADRAVERGAANTG